MPADQGISTLKELVQSIDEQLGLICGDESQVRQDCSDFAQLLSHPPTAYQQKYLKELARILARCDDFIALPVYDLLAEVVAKLRNPWPILKLMLHSEEDGILEQSIQLVLELVNEEHLSLSRGILQECARLFDREFSPFEEEDLLALLVSTVHNHSRTAGDDGLLGLFRKDPDDSIRKLAAKLMDCSGGPVSRPAAQKVLGKNAYGVLAPYLDFTRANYSDLFDLSGGKVLSKKIVEQFRVASADHGEALVREVVSAFGWAKVSQGVRIEQFLEVNVPGSLPILTPVLESKLFIDSEAAIGRTLLLATAHGGMSENQKKEKNQSDPVDGFRILNITHAELLGEILDVAPLDKEKVERINTYIDSVVKSYVALFTDVSDECSILPDVWQTLRDQVVSCLPAEADTGPLSAELTRLVLAFEEPKNLGEVRTVHGLKRYLHQMGLKLGFEMVGESHAPNRTVDLMLLHKNGHQIRTGTIRYAEFEGGAEKLYDHWLPYPVKVVVDGFSRQLLYGTENFPSVDVFIFGNEVHYYITFRNHPAFLRVDFSPPQRGGMLDLEYYGVSNYELDVHPNLNLDAIRLLYRKLDFDIKIEGTRLFVRYDKERSNSLGDLCDHVESLFRLAPYLMDFDWVIGSLQLSDQSRNLVAEYWADRFRHSGVLPLNSILNQKRTGILMGRADGPTGVKELLWDGCLPYRDHFSEDMPASFTDQVALSLENLGISTSGLENNVQAMPCNLLTMEKVFLNPVTEAFRLGCIELRNNELQPVQTDLYQEVHEADFFAELLAGNDEQVHAAILLSRPLSELERFVSFTPTGFVGGLSVERTSITVRGGALWVFAARDSHGVIRLGFFALDSRLVRSRTSVRKPWQSNVIVDAGRLWELMRSANYLASAPAAAEFDLEKDLHDLRNLASLHRPAANTLPMDGESLLQGLKSAPGRAVGRAVFGTAGRQPGDLEGAILVAREVRPDDNQFLSRSSGILSTGGAVLSHAALLAIQFGKPALVAEAEWDDSGSASSLSFSVTVFQEIERLVAGFSVCLRVVENHRIDELIENDLIILDANEGVVRILGQQRDTLALWDGFHLLGDASDRADSTIDDKGILEVRAQQLRARHQIQRILDRLKDPVLTAFAVEELVIGETLATVKNADKIRLLARILANDEVVATAQAKLKEISLLTADRCRSAEGTALEYIPTAGFLYEVLGLRLRAMQWLEAFDGVLNLLKRCALESALPVCSCQSDLDSITHVRLNSLRLELLAKLADGGPAVRHLIRRIGRIGIVLSTAVPLPQTLLDAQENLAAVDHRTLVQGHQKMVLTSAQCGLESHPQIGWKAANLAEIDRLAGKETVPQYFVVTNYAFNMMQHQPVGSSAYLRVGINTLGAAIKHILQQGDLDNKKKSLAIRDLWESMEIPSAMRCDILSAYKIIAGAEADESFVAVRSSSCDEDTEKVMRAGEFETYLYVRGEDSLCEHLLLTWSGLWTERSLYTRQATGTILQWPTGGIIVQRMVRSRISGVLQTVNVARGDLREMMVNVGLGLGEGIVSGLVAADLITVVKDFAPDEDPVHLNYLTNDKPQQMVFDYRRGRGTRLQDTLYHQRLRPALEYSELCEVVAKASMLERAYGYPLDIEFAIEDTRLWLLQARPIATFSAEFQDTIKKYPLNTQHQIVQNQEC